MQLSGRTVLVTGGASGLGGAAVDMVVACGGRAVVIDLNEEAGRAMLRGYRFVIMANGYASVVPAAPDDVHGLLWRIGPRDLAALDEYEDVAGGMYRHATLPVLQDGRTMDALVYIGCELREGRPRPGYIPLVVEAARDARADVVVLGEHHHGFLGSLFGTDVAAGVERELGSAVIVA